MLGQQRAHCLQGDELRVTSCYKNLSYNLIFAWLHSFAIQRMPRHRQSESPDMQFRRVACGAAHTCGLTAVFRLKCAMT